MARKIRGRILKFSSRRTFSTSNNWKGAIHKEKRKEG